MNKLVPILFTLSIILVNPFGLNRGEIWSQPKILAIELICILNWFIISEKFHSIRFSRNWKIVVFLWGLFLSIGILATIYSPIPLRSLLGQSTMKSGLLYYGLMAIFTLSNALVLKLKPEVARKQVQGLLIGGGILAASTFPQMVNWKVDYTATMGSLIDVHILKSTIFRGHQPIGLYSHRGHAAFTLAAVGVMALAAYRQRWIKINQFLPYVAVVLPALIFTQTRAGLLAFIIATGYLLGRKHYKLIAVGAIALILTITLISTNRSINNLPLIKQITSDRVNLWEMSVKRIQQRPLIGWGFDGFEIAYPYRPDGSIRTDKPPSSKSHNLVLDSAISVGIIGTVVYLGLIGFCLYLVLKSSIAGIVAVAIAYLAYTFTWYECAQFTHIFWWSLSFFDYEKVTRSSFISNQSISSYGSMVARQLLQVGRAAQRTERRIRGWISTAKARIFK